MKLKELRKSKGLTQEEAADICGLSRRGYQNLEMGTYKNQSSKTLQYVLAQLDSLPSPKQRKSGLSLVTIARALEDQFDEGEVEYAYLLKEGQTLTFALATSMDDRLLYSNEEEISSILKTEVRFIRLGDLFENKEEAMAFFSKAKRVYPQ